MKQVQSFLRSCMLQVALELQVCYRATWRDIPAAVFTGCAFTSLAAKYHELSLNCYLQLMPWTFAYFLLNLYSFNLCNQITGADEDKTDKPDRPIPSGLLTLQGAKYRWYLITIAYIVASVAIGNVWSCFLWIAVTPMYCHRGWDRHWFTKNCISMTLGTFVIGWAAWSIIYGHPWMNTTYAVTVVTLSLCVGITANLQDLRDVEGDRASGRLTMPISLGMPASKQFLSLVFIIVPVILYFTIWNQSLYLSGDLNTLIFKLVYIFADVLAHLYIALRLLYLDQTYADLHHTYHFFTKTFPFTVLSATI